MSSFLMLIFNSLKNHGVASSRVSPQKNQDCIVTTQPLPVSRSLSIRRALLSVSDKTGLVTLAQTLAGLGVALLSTGGTAAALREAGLEVTDVSEVTGFPEILDGRVKTLHPAVHGGILAKRHKPDHMATLTAQNIAPIDLVVINLYPFETTLSSGADWSSCIEQIDVGGPAMIRAAAKNHHGVAVLTAPDQYADFLDELRETNGQTTLTTRARLAAVAFARTAAYDGAIAAAFAAEAGEGLPPTLVVTAERLETLRYGENPHQEAAFYVTSPRRPGVATARQLQGKTLSYNNLNDADAGFGLVSEFPEPAVAIIKHANPCGVAIADSLSLAYQKALACDPVSAFGGIVAVNRELDGTTATAIAELFAEVIIAPSFSTAAQDILASKKNLRLLATGTLMAPGGWQLRGVTGGLLVQTADTRPLLSSDLHTVTRRAPTAYEITDMLFAFRVAKHVKSNAIVLARDGASLGVGAGQMSRVDAVRIAVRKAEDAGLSLRGAAIASDAFFPFADGLQLALAAGIQAAIQPGGSKRDSEVIAAADAAGATMVVTGVRHFRH
jgi:phosphoribosylaminoimidazolecarboxamide formyltransferase / IMP cyclohydrolase